MLSKWEWLEQACAFHGFSESAKLAKKIENILQKLYGDTKTISWMEEYKNFDYHIFAHILYVTYSAIYCIACIKSKNRNKNYCDECQLAHVDYRCADRNSMYSKFRNCLMIEKEEHVNRKILL